MSHYQATITAQVSPPPPPTNSAFDVAATLGHDATKYTVNHVSVSGDSGTINQYKWVLTLLDQDNATVEIIGNDLESGPTMITDSRSIPEASNWNESSFSSIAGPADDNGDSTVVTMQSLVIDKLSTALFGRIHFQYQVTDGAGDVGLLDLEQYGIFATDPLPVLDCTPDNFLDQVAALKAANNGTLNLTVPGHYDLTGVKAGDTQLRLDNFGDLKIKGLGKGAGTILRLSDNNGHNQVRTINIEGVNKMEVCDLDMDGAYVDHVHPDTPTRHNPIVQHGAVNFWQTNPTIPYDWMANHGVPSGPDGHGDTVALFHQNIFHQSNVFIRGASNLLFRNVASYGAGADCINIGAVNDMFLDNMSMDDTLRNGLTLGGAGTTNENIGIGGNCTFGPDLNVQAIDCEHSIVNRNCWVQSGLVAQPQPYDGIDKDQIWAVTATDGFHIGDVDAGKAVILMRDALGVTCTDTKNIGGQVIDGESGVVTMINPEYDIDGSKLRRVIEGVPGVLLAGILCRTANGGTPDGIEIIDGTIEANNVPTDVIECLNIPYGKITGTILTGDGLWDRALRLNGQPANPMTIELANNSANLAPFITDNVTVI